mmetsp:Transcript_4728/g.8941  ORF Transcript_4728/g.8941 Transcript_4728/m.8941 type:complete len:259 (-) Transcript_4728:309-1085(-)
MAGRALATRRDDCLELTPSMKSSSSARSSTSPDALAPSDARSYLLPSCAFSGFWRAAVPVLTILRSRASSRRLISFSRARVSVCWRRCLISSFSPSMSLDDARCVRGSLSSPPPPRSLICCSSIVFFRNSLAMTSSFSLLFRRTDSTVPRASCSCCSSAPAGAARGALAPCLAASRSASAHASCPSRLASLPSLSAALSLNNCIRSSFFFRNSVRPWIRRVCSASIWSAFLSLSSNAAVLASPSDVGHATAACRASSS